MPVLVEHDATGSYRYANRPKDAIERACQQVAKDVVGLVLTGASRLEVSWLLEERVRQLLHGRTEGFAD